MTWLLDILYALRARLRGWWGRRTLPAPTPEQEAAHAAAYAHHNQVEPAQRAMLIAVYRWHTKQITPDGVRRFGIYGPGGAEPEEWVWMPHLLPLSPACAEACRKYGFDRLLLSVMPALWEICEREGRPTRLEADEFYDAILNAIPGAVRTSLAARDEVIAQMQYRPGMVQEITFDAAAASLHLGPLHNPDKPELPPYTGHKARRP